MPQYRVVRAAAATSDFDAIDNHLVRSYQAFGLDGEEAGERSLRRIEDAQSFLRGLQTHPYRGTALPELGPLLRAVTHKNFVFYFEVDNANFEVIILAVFFSGADHRSQILERLGRS